MSPPRKRMQYTSTSVCVCATISRAVFFQKNCPGKHTQEHQRLSGVDAPRNWASLGSYCDEQAPVHFALEDRTQSKLLETAAPRTIETLSLERLGASLQCHKHHTNSRSCPTGGVACRNTVCGRSTFFLVMQERHTRVNSEDSA